MINKLEGISFSALLDVSDNFIFEDQYPTDVLERMQASASEALEAAPWIHGRRAAEVVLSRLDEELKFRAGMLACQRTQ